MATRKRGAPVADEVSPDLLSAPEGTKPRRSRRAPVHPKPPQDQCPHPKARVLKGLCMACGTGGLSG